MAVRRGTSALYLHFAGTVICVIYLQSLCQLKPENDQSSFWQTSPRHAVQGPRRTSLRFSKLRHGKQFRPENDISLICCIFNNPGINWQIEVFDGGVQPNPIFSVFHCFQYKNNPRFLSGLYCVIRTLPHRLTPVITKIKFNRMGIRHAIATGTIRQYHFDLRERENGDVRHIFIFRENGDVRHIFIFGFP